MKHLRQIIPSEYCLKCDVCCRFPEAQSSQRPYSESKGRHLKLKPYQDYCICPNFNPVSHICHIYKNRPFDCRLYPFTITYDKQNEKVLLGMDTKCPFIANNLKNLKLNNYKNYILKYMRSKAAINFVSQNPKILGPFQDDIITFDTLPIGPLKIKIKYHKLKSLTLKDRPIFEKYFKKHICDLSAYSFAGIFLWKGLFKIYYRIINGNLCVFFEQSSTFFMVIAPVGNAKTLNKTVVECFDITDSLNAGGSSSRIENIDEKYAVDFRNAGFKICEKHPEYLYDRKKLAELKGSKFKDKRNLCNYFEKKYRFKYLPYKGKFKEECLNLYLNWADYKGKICQDKISNYLLEDSYILHKNILENYKKLGLQGIAVFIDGRLSAYTFGYKINKGIFCVIAEICGPAIKGLPQFIFRQFACQIKEPFINTMDDSGIESLKANKLSYQPLRLLNCYIATKISPLPRL